MTLPIETFALWLANGERGMSSDAIVQRATGVRVGDSFGSCPAIPYDPSDSRRCMLLIQSYPILRSILPEMSAVSVQWANIVSHWDELESLYNLEKDNSNGTAPRLYRRLRELREQAVTGDE